MFQLDIGWIAWLIDFINDRSCDDSSMFLSTVFVVLDALIVDQGLSC